MGPWPRHPTLTPTEVIDRVRAARKADQQAAVEQLELALEWARLHPCPANETPAHWGEADLHDEGLVPLAGPGAPWVAEFAPVDLAAALGITQDAGRQLIADALELAHRLPRLWERVVAGEVPVWRARLIARETTDLSVEAALFADRLIAATPRRIGQVQAARLVQEARLYFDPDRALADEEEALAKRGVWLRHGSAPATTDITMTLDTPDALLFDQTVTRIAGDLKRARRHRGPRGPPRTRGRDPRRPPARPRPPLRPRRRRTHPRRPCRRGEPLRAPHPRRPGRRPGREHRCRLDREARRGHHPAAHRLAHPVRGSRHQDHPPPRPRPRVATAAVDQHDPPEAMRETVVLRDAHCVFPGCRRDSRICDLDHITEYLPMEDGGPPGQTRPANLAPLCRTHHRVKTHTAWHYKRLDDGSYVWTAPTGHQYRVTPASRRTAPWSRLTARCARCSTTCG